MSEAVAWTRTEMDQPSAAHSLEVNVWSSACPFHVRSPAHSSAPTHMVWFSLTLLLPLHTRGAPSATVTMPRPSVPVEILICVQKETNVKAGPKEVCVAGDDDDGAQVSISDQQPPTQDCTHSWVGRDLPHTKDRDSS